MDPFPYEPLFLISTSHPWYGDIILYLQTNISILNCLMMTADVYAINIDTISLSMILFTITMLIVSYDDVLVILKLNMS